MEFTCTFIIKGFTFNTNGRNVSGYTCRVNKINYNPLLKTIVIKGDHQEDRTHEDVVGFTLENIKLERIPYGLTKHFPNLKYLQFRKCGLKTLTKRDLIEFDHLQGLWLPENNITSLDSNVFENCRGIRNLCFFQNKLKIIGSNIFGSLKELTDANFMENTCINKNYQQGNQKQYDELKEDIIRKCQPATEVNNTDEYVLEAIAMKKEIVTLKNRAANFEKRIANLEAENLANAQMISRVAILEQIISDLQIRMASLDH